MLELSDVPLFARIGEDSSRLLHEVASLRQVSAGSLVMRRGAHCGELLVVASGALRVNPIAAASRALGVGEVLGEMSLVSDAAVSATVTAIEDSILWVVPGDTFLRLIDREPSLDRELLKVLARRLRNSDSTRSPAPGRQVVVVTETLEPGPPARFWRALEAALARHRVQVRCVTHACAKAALEELESWRQQEGEAALLLYLPTSELDALAPRLAREDAVLAPAEQAGRVPHGLADVALLRFPEDAPLATAAPWAFELCTQELEAVESGLTPSRRATPRLDRLARWVVRKELGIALGAGAARGFAHLGVLAELEALGLPVDRIAGTSMGGIAGLLYGLGGNGQRGIELAQGALGKRGAAHLRLWPRSSLFSDTELRRRARAVAGERTFAELPLPVAVVATDLVRGGRVVIDRGSVAEGFFATSAVPGVLPPVFDGDRTLVDGALVARIPLDLLPPWRSGLRIAVNVLPAPGESSVWAEEGRTLRKRIQSLFGFREVLSRSWNHLGWNHGARDAAEADVLLEPRTHEHSGIDFATAWEPMVEAGREAVREHASELRAAAAELFEPDFATRGRSPTEVLE